MDSQTPQAIFLDLTSKDLLIAGGWLLTAISWFVTNNQATKRERRKEVRSEVDACCKLLADLLIKVRAYYSTPSTDLANKPRAAEIRFELQRLITRAERLENLFPKFDVTGVCGELFDSISGNEFESSDRALHQVDDDFFVKVEADVHCFINQLEDGFALSFK